MAHRIAFLLVLLLSFQLRDARAVERAQASAENCVLVVMIEGPMDSDSHNFLRLDRCSRPDAKSVRFQVEGDQPGVTKRKASANDWRLALDRIDREFAQLEQTPDNPTIRCILPVRVHWKRNGQGEAVEVARCPVGAAGERVQALAREIRELGGLVK